MRQWLPPLAAAVYWIGVGLRARLFRRRLGHSPNLRPRNKREKALWAGWALVSVGWAAAPFFGGIWPIFGGPWWLFLGATVILAGMAGTVWSHLSMGDAWRVGVRVDEKTPLVTTGPYQLIRHPIYSFQCLILVGVFLLAPSPMMLFVILAHLYLVWLKIRDEESHMAQLHGPLYKEYALRTGSLWPRFKRA